MKKLILSTLLILSAIITGCLGVSSKPSVTDISHIIDLNLSGRIFFSDRNRYGNIAVRVYNQTGILIAEATTDEAGYFGFADLPSGIYDLHAISGDSECVFAKNINVTQSQPKNIGDISLLGVSYARITNINHESFNIYVRSNRLSEAKIIYYRPGGQEQNKTLSENGALNHQTSITDLDAQTDYNIIVVLTGLDGQTFELRGLSMTTTSTEGPTNLAFHINEGQYETSNRNVTLDIHADNASQMRIAESLDELYASEWSGYSRSQLYTFSSTTDTFETTNGTRRLFIQFRDDQGRISEIQNARILLNKTGYVGIWIEDGLAITNKQSVSLKIVFPGAEQMKISNTSDFENSFWEPYSQTKSWRLTDNDGVKTVFARFKGGRADPEDIFSSSIVLDTTPPEVKIIINDGNKYTSSATVELGFITDVPPAKMKISNAEPPTDDDKWLDFETPYSWELEEGEGEKRVYGIFKDAAGNIYGPVHSTIELDTTPPTGNTFTIREGQNAASQETDFALAASMPLYLHFNIADESTYQAQYLFTDIYASAPEDIELISVEAPFSPRVISLSDTSMGENKLWCRFKDFAGNYSFFEYSFLTVDGPYIEIEPRIVSLRSGMQQQFTATPVNVSPGEHGTIRWEIQTGSGTINSEGLYEAPAPVLDSSRTEIRAWYSQSSSIQGNARVNLTTSKELLFKKESGELAYEIDEIVVSPGETATLEIVTLHGSDGVESSGPLNPDYGSVNILEATEEEKGFSNIIEYTAPAEVPTPNTVEVGFSSIESPSLTASVTFFITQGAHITLTPLSGEAQRGIPLEISASVLNTDEDEMEWRIDNPSFGSFDSEVPGISTITTVSPNHRVTFYADDSLTIASKTFISAEIDDAVKETEVTVKPPISFVIAPVEAEALPVVTPLEFNAISFENIGNISEEVIWEYKNASSSVFSPADGRTFADRGSLEIQGPTTAIYTRPSNSPESIGLGNKIIIRATHKIDKMASATAEVTITEDVEVRIYRDIERTETITEASTVAEVGKLRFYALVEPAQIADQSVTWTVNGTSGNNQVGFIDEEGLYTAPSNIESNKVTIRATSNYDSRRFAEVEVGLSEFWIPKRDDMYADTGEPMQITSLFIDPNTAAGEDFEIFAGTNGHGLYYARFSGEAKDTTTIATWQGITNLNQSSTSQNSSMIINHLSMCPNDHLFAATASGVWHIDRDAYIASPLIRNLTPIDVNNFLNISFDRKEPDLMFLATRFGIYRCTFDTANFTGELTIDSFNAHRVFETRTDETASPTVEITAYSNQLLPNPINSQMQALAYDDFGDNLFGGGRNGVLVRSRNPEAHNLSFHPNSYVFAAPTGVATITRNVYMLTDNQPDQSTVPGGDIRMLAIDPVNRNTIWAATTGGVYRSLNSGDTWFNAGFGPAGSNTNTRAIIVDPTNTINVMAGSEDGLYRSTDAGNSWTRIRSGLGEHKTITAIIQAPGQAGTRRKVWVGTAGGVFMGRQPLELE